MQIPRQTTARVLVSAFAFALGIPQSAQAAPTSPKAERTAHQGHPPAKHVRRAKVRKKVRKNRSRVRKTERTKARPQRQRPQKKASSRRTPHTKPPALRVERATSVAPLSAREHAIVQAARRYLGASYRLGGRGDTAHSIALDLSYGSTPTAASPLRAPPPPKPATASPLPSATSAPVTSCILARRSITPESSCAITAERW